jgi:hypothetical protein
MKLLTTTEASRILNIPREWAADLCSRGDVKAYKKNERWRIVPRSLKRYAQRREIRQQFQTWLFNLKLNEFAQYGGDREFYINLYQGYIAGTVRNRYYDHSSKPYEREVEIEVDQEDVPYVQQQMELFYRVNNGETHFHNYQLWMAFMCVVQASNSCKVGNS